MNILCRGIRAATGKQSDQVLHVLEHWSDCWPLAGREGVGGGSDVSTWASLRDSTFGDPWQYRAHNHLSQIMIAYKSVDAIVGSTNGIVLIVIIQQSYKKV